MNMLKNIRNINFGRSKPENVHLKQIRSAMKLQNHLTLLNTITFDHNNNCSAHHNWHQRDPFQETERWDDSIREVHNHSWAVKRYAPQYSHNRESPWTTEEQSRRRIRNSLFTAEEMFQRGQSITETISDRDECINEQLNDNGELVLNSMNVSRIFFTL